jgi:hypothetical protein
VSERRNLKESDVLEELGLECRIILKWMLNKEDGTACTELIWLWIGTYKHVNLLSGSIKFGLLLA